MILLKYEVTVKDDYSDQQHTGQFFATNENDAIEQAADHYATLRDTDPEAIEIINCTQIPY